MKFEIGDYVVVTGGHVVILTNKGFGSYFGKKATQNESFDYFREDLIRAATASEIAKYNSARDAARKRDQARFLRENEERARIRAEEKAREKAEQPALEQPIAQPEISSEITKVN
jgi:hypothetical protein